MTNLLASCALLLHLLPSSLLLHFFALLTKSPFLNMPDLIVDDLLFLCAMPWFRVTICRCLCGRVWPIFCLPFLKREIIAVSMLSFPSSTTIRHRVGGRSSRLKFPQFPLFKLKLVPKLFVLVLNLFIPLWLLKYWRYWSQHGWSDWFVQSWVEVLLFLFRCGCKRKAGRAIRRQVRLKIYSPHGSKTGADVSFPSRYISHRSRLK